MEDAETNTPYDDAFRTMITDSSILAISLINTMFGEHIDPSATMITLQNEVYLATGKKKITDSHIQIEGVNHFFHIECESISGDSGILVRLFEYDSSVAISHATIEGNTLNVTFPKTGVLFLRNTANTPDDLRMVIRSPYTDESIDIPVSVMKAKSYSLNDIIENRLWFMIPFYAFSLETKINDSTNTSDDEILGIYNRIKEYLNETNESGEIDTYTRKLLERLIKLVFSGVARNHDNLRKGVDSIMGGKVLEYEEKDILRRGIKQGIEKGREEDRSSLVQTMLRKGKTPESINEFTDIPLSYIANVQKQMMVMEESKYNP